MGFFGGTVGSGTLVGLEVKPASTLASRIDVSFCVYVHNFFLFILFLESSIALFENVSKSLSARLGAFKLFL